MIHKIVGAAEFEERMSDMRSVMLTPTRLQIGETVYVTREAPAWVAHWRKCAAELLGWLEEE